MIIEGPIVTYAASLAASLGFFDVWIIFSLAFFGGFLPDILFYLIGRFSRGQGVEKLVSRFGLTKIKIKKLEANLSKHFGKTIIFIKLNPVLPLPGLILSGFVKIPFKKFILIDFIFNLGGALIFTLLGFYSGLAVNTFAKFLNLGEIVIPFIIILLITVYFLIRKFTGIIARKEERG